MPSPSNLDRIYDDHAQALFLNIASADSGGSRVDRARRVGGSPQLLLALEQQRQLRAELTEPLPLMVSEERTKPQGPRSEAASSNFNA